MLMTSIELSIAIGEFAQSIAELSASDLGTSLSRSVAGLADIERKSQELQATQSQQDVMTFMSTGTPSCA
jgi:sorting nexin-1/2